MQLSERGAWHTRHLNAQRMYLGLQSRAFGAFSRTVLPLKQPRAGTRGADILMMRSRPL